MYFYFLLMVFAFPATLSNSAFLPHLISIGIGFFSSLFFEIQLFLSLLYKVRSEGHLLF